MEASWTPTPGGAMVPLSPEVLSVTGDSWAVPFVTTAREHEECALELGAQQYMKIHDPDVVLGLEHFTLAIKFRRDGRGGNSNTGSGGFHAEPLLTKGRGESDGSSVDMNWGLFICDPDGTPRLCADFEDFSAGQNYPVYASTGDIETGTWHTGVATYDGSSWTLYLDGVQVGSASPGTTPRHDSIQWAAIGTALTSSAQPEGHFVGQVTDARVWDSAFSSDEIGRMASEGYGYVTPVAPVVEYRFCGEANATTVASTGVHMLEGELVNGPTIAVSTITVSADTYATIEVNETYVCPSRINVSNPFGNESHAFDIARDGENVTIRREDGRAWDVDLEVECCKQSHSWAAESAAGGCVVADLGELGTHATVCDPAQWQGYDHQTCGTCSALVNVRDNGGTCADYCAIQGLPCLQAWDDVAGETCSPDSPHLGCDHIFTGTSDGICECAGATEPATVPDGHICPAVVNSTNWLGHCNGTDLDGATLKPDDGETLAGTYCNVGLFIVAPGRTVLVAPGEELRVFAQRIAIQGTLSADGAGSPGGASPTSGSGTGSAGSGTGGGGGGPGECSGNGRGGGGGGYGTVGDPGEGPSASCTASGGALFGETFPRDVFFGAGGGSGGNDNAVGDNPNGGRGGSGGGIIVLHGEERVVVSGTISANGADGQGDGTTNAPIPPDTIDCSPSGSSTVSCWDYSGGGGGGSGGSVLITYADFYVAQSSAEISVRGGFGGNAHTTNSGGDGGEGRFAAMPSASFRIMQEGTTVTAQPMTDHAADAPDRLRFECCELELPSLKSMSWGCDWHEALEFDFDCVVDVPAVEFQLAVRGGERPLLISLDEQPREPWAPNASHGASWSWGTYQGEGNASVIRPDERHRLTLWSGPGAPEIGAVRFADDIGLACRFLAPISPFVIEDTWLGHEVAATRGTAWGPIQFADNDPHSTCIAEGGSLRTRAPAGPTGDVCCAAACGGVCGGSGCSDLPGGSENCCVGNIEDAAQASGLSCAGTGGVPPCLIGDGWEWSSAYVKPWERPAHCPAPAWRHIFRQRQGTYLPVTDWIRYNAGDHSGDFSELDELEDCRGRDDGKLHLKLVFPQMDGPNTNEWKQTTNPVTAGRGGVEGYEPIEISHTGQTWGGLEYNGASSLLDGSVSVSSWWYAIGSTADYSPGGMPGPAVVVSETELYAMCSPPAESEECDPDAVKLCDLESPDTGCGQLEFSYECRVAADVSFELEAIRPHAEAFLHVRLDGGPAELALSDSVDGWRLMLRQTGGNYMSASSWVRHAASGPDADFSVLDELEDCRRMDGKLHMKLFWPELDASQEWKQTVRLMFFF